MINGYVLWEGKSLLDGNPIVAVATGFNKSKNRKTGTMIQIWIIRSDMNPLEAINHGQDKSICGNCKHRTPTEHNPSGWGTCYVHVPQAPLGVYRAYKRGIYPQANNFNWRDIFAGRRVRFGAYGDPAAVPFVIWKWIDKFSDYHTGYTHQWLKCDQRLKDLVMASVDSPAEYERAQAMGWRTFRVRLPDEVLSHNERVCPASEEAGKKATCYSCTACHGGGSQKASIAIIAHGGTWKPERFVQIRVLQGEHKPHLPVLLDVIKNRETKDIYYRHGFRIRVVRDKRGNVIRKIKTQTEKATCPA